MYYSLLFFLDIQHIIFWGYFIRLICTLIFFSMGVLGQVGRPEKNEIEHFSGLGLPPWPRISTTFRKNNFTEKNYTVLQKDNRSTSYPIFIKKLKNLYFYLRTNLLTWEKCLKKSRHFQYVNFAKNWTLFPLWNPYFFLFLIQIEWNLIYRLMV